MIGQVEFYEKVGFQNILSERCYEYLVEKETIGVQIQKPMGMLLRFLRMCLANGNHWIMPPKARLSAGMKRISMKLLATIITVPQKSGDSCST